MQIIKATLLIVGTFVMAVWVLGKYGFNLSSVFQGAVDKAGGGAKGEAPAQPMKQYGKTTTSKIDFISLSLALVLGTAACRTCSCASTPSRPPRRRASRWSGRSG